VNTVVDWITKAPNGSADLVMMYFNQPDHDNHAYGPGSVEVTNAIISMDFFFGQLISRLALRGVLADVDIVLVADHGVSAISTARTVELSIPQNLSAYAMGSPVTQIWPKDVRLGAPGNASSPEFRSWFDSIHDPLMQFAQGSGGHLSIYARDDIPAHFHFTGPLVAPFVAVTSPGWMVKSLYPFGNKGAHGYTRHLLMHL
jgi:predicted AlkP superfamily pyrophosphatase or phosphodiesterase